VTQVQFRIALHKARYLLARADYNLHIRSTAGD